MTRELSPKAAAALLRKTFNEKGAPLAHTEALDLVAKLKGFNAWSHLQSASGSATSKALPPTAKPSQPGRFSVAESLILHYGPDGECPSYARATWLHQEPQTPYWDWVADCLRSNGTWVNTDLFTMPPPVKVTLSNGTEALWNIEQNLTDRWGEINDAHWYSKPALPVLYADQDMLDQLVSQMCDEDTFVTRKDGQFGLLFEFEYLCDESENNNEDDPDDYAPRAEVVAGLLKALTELEKKYPQVEFCVPDPTHIFYERPAIWGFFKPGSLTKEQRDELSFALYRVF